MRFEIGENRILFWLILFWEIWVNRFVVYIQDDLLNSI
jgi:hypothetical protein